MMDKGGVGDDMGDGMQCSNHPYKNNPGGICAFCLKEKLGRLVSSSKSDPSFFPIPIPSSSSSSPSSRSDHRHHNLAAASSSLTLSLSVPDPTSSSSSSNSNNYRHNHRSRAPFPLTQKKTKKVMASPYAVNNNLVMLKRSKSSAAPRRNPHTIFNNDHDGADEYSHRKHRGFWSFLHLSSSYSRRISFRDRVEVSESKPSDVHPATTTSISTQLDGGDAAPRRDYGNENESPNSSSHASSSSSSFGRKVARSRSVGCGSRSFSGAFLERISTGFGDCSTLRRVASQRESSASTTNNNKQQQQQQQGLSKVVVLDHHHHTRIKERVKCGGVFGGFSVTSSSSSASYCLPSSAQDTNMNNNTTTTTGNNGALTAGGSPHVRSKSWGWAFASPMKAFRPSSSSSKPGDDKVGGPASASAAATTSDILFL